MTCQAGVDILRFLSLNANAMVKMHFHYHHRDLILFYLLTNELFDDQRIIRYCYG